MTDLLPEGVWLNLPAEEYFPQGLGASDLIGLHKKRLGWWWSSRHNPRHKPKATAEQTYGSALHAIVLEGVRAYEARYAPAPIKPVGAVETIEEMKGALREGGFVLKGVSGWSHADWCKAMRENMPRFPCWPNILENWRLKVLAGREEISADDDWALRFMAEVIYDPDRTDNVDVRTLFAGDGGYPPLAEVSIFAEVDGIRRRWRIDRMFPRIDIDLKSMGNWGGRPLEYETGDLIAKYRYDLQREDYYDGRRAAYEHIRAGRIYGGTPEQRAWLRRFPDEFPDWDWTWVFYQKPDMVAGRAPIVLPVWDDSWDVVGGERVPGAMRARGARKKAKALALYRRAVAEFGLDKPWATVLPLHYTDDRFSPSIRFPAWIEEDEPTEEGAYA